MGESEGRAVGEARGAERAAAGPASPADTERPPVEPGSLAGPGGAAAEAAVAVGSAGAGLKEPWVPSPGRGRVNQKQRTRRAIIDAAKRLAASGGEITMPVVAREALVSEATAYRYFPDLASLLREADEGTWPSPADALAPVADSTDVVARVAFAAEFLFRGVLANQGAVRAMIAAAITKPGGHDRPGHRLGLIDHALAPAAGRLGAGGLAQLRRDLAVVLSADALFTVMDLCGLDPEAAIASAVETARRVTRAALADAGP